MTSALPFPPGSASKLPKGNEKHQKKDQRHNSAGTTTSPTQVRSQAEPTLLLAGFYYTVAHALIRAVRITSLLRCSITPSARPSRCYAGTRHGTIRTPCRVRIGSAGWSNGRLQRWACSARSSKASPRSPTGRIPSRACLPASASWACFAVCPCPREVITRHALAIEALT
jgi:hypothetical protein